MKKLLSVIGVFLLIIMLTACRGGDKKDTPESSEPEIKGMEKIREEEPADKVDIDLTGLNQNMIFGEMYNMLATPEDYFGKTVKITGQFDSVVDEQTGRRYYAVFVLDATACCQQGWEFEVKDNYKYPDDFPKPGDEITVTGEYSSFEEGEFKYCGLIKADIEIPKTASEE